MTSCCFVEYRRDWSDNTNRKKNSKYLRDFKKIPPPNKQWGWMDSSGWEEEKVEEKQASKQAYYKTPPMDENAKPVFKNAACLPASLPSCTTANTRDD